MNRELLLANIEKEQEIEKLKQENKQLKEKIDIILEDNNQLEEIRIKAIECINYYAIEDDDFNKIYNVEEQELLQLLENKEIEEIPQFKGTLEQLDNLTMLGDKE